MSLQAVLAKFPVTKKTGGQWLVKCPAHDDRVASLAIREGAEDRVLLHCHAGCSTEAILAALSLDEQDLFEESRPITDSSSRQITDTYDYVNEKGEVLYQAVRFFPKDFRQRRPDGAGGWIWSLSDTRRVLYRLKELQNKPGVVIVEGEKDANRAWAAGVPATTNVGGSGKWSSDYTKQLVAAGVRRVVVIPDNDVPGRKHATDIAAALVEAGITVRLLILPDVPPKGDLSDYLDQHSKEDFVALLKQAPIWTPESDPTATPEAKPITTFTAMDGKYVWAVLPPGVMFELERVRRDHHELCGELTVRTDISGTSRTQGGALMTAEFNLSSARARAERAKLLGQRAKTGDSLDWFGLLEEFCERVFEAERSGAPPIRLDEGEITERHDEAVQIDGLTLLMHHPIILFGDGGTAKSYFALYLAGRLAQQGHRVLYADWELLSDEHRVRLYRLFGVDRPQLWYLSCDRPLVAEKDRLEKTVRANRLDYMVLDSVAVACDGPPEAAEVTTSYFRALRSIGVGSLSIAHTNKSEHADKKPFGSSFWHNLARATFYCQRSEESDDPKGLTIGLFNRKANLGPIAPAVSFKLHFGTTNTTVESTDVRDSPDLAGQLALWQRIQGVLINGPMTTAAIAEALDARPNTVVVAVRRRPRIFERLTSADGIQRVKLVSGFATRNPAEAEREREEA